MLTNCGYWKTIFVGVLGAVVGTVLDVLVQQLQTGRVDVDQLKTVALIGAAISVKSLFIQPPNKRKQE